MELDTTRIVTSFEINTLRPREGWTTVAFPPPLALTKQFSGLSYRGNLSLYSRVMQNGLNTDSAAKAHYGVLRCRYLSIGTQS